MLTPVLALAMMQQQDTHKGSFLVAQCRSVVRMQDKDAGANVTVDAEAASYCLGYFEGLTAFMDPTASGVCLNQATPGTLVRVYVAYMDKHPKAFDESKSAGAYFSSSNSLPVPRRSRLRHFYRWVQACMMRAMVRSRTSSVSS